MRACVRACVCVCVSALAQLEASAGSLRFRFGTFIWLRDFPASWWEDSPLVKPELLTSPSIVIKLWTYYWGYSQGMKPHIWADLLWGVHSISGVWIIGHWPRWNIYVCGWPWQLGLAIVYITFSKFSRLYLQVWHEWTWCDVHRFVHAPYAVC